MKILNVINQMDSFVIRTLINFLAEHGLTDELSKDAELLFKVVKCNYAGFIRKYRSLYKGGIDLSELSLEFMQLFYKDYALLPDKVPVVFKGSVDDYFRIFPFLNIRYVKLIINKRIRIKDSDFPTLGFSFPFDERIVEDLFSRIKSGDLWLQRDLGLTAQLEGADLKYKQFTVFDWRGKIKVKELTRNFIDVAQYVIGFKLADFFNVPLKIDARGNAPAFAGNVRCSATVIDYDHQKVLYQDKLVPAALLKVIPKGCDVHKCYTSVYNQIEIVPA